jgi:hypothetical protein
MARRLKFSTYQPSTEEPIEVEINDGNLFYFKPSMPGTELLGYLANIDEGNQALAAQTIQNLFRNTVITDPAEFPLADPPVPENNSEAFFDYVGDNDHHVDLAKLQEIANDLLGEIADGRPTQSSQKSDDGSATNGSGSTERRSEKVATSKRSRSGN